MIFRGQQDVAARVKTLLRIKVFLVQNFMNGNPSDVTNMKFGNKRNSLLAVDQCLSYSK
jgi:hypothetical protein